MVRSAIDFIEALISTKSKVMKNTLLTRFNLPICYVNDGLTRVELATLLNDDRGNFAVD